MLPNNTIKPNQQLNNNSTPSNPSASYIVGSSIMNSNITLQSSRFQVAEDNDDMNMENDLGNNESVTLLEDEEEINFDDEPINNNNIIVKKEPEEENYYQASQVLDEIDEEINFDDEVMNQQHSLLATASKLIATPIAPTISCEEEEEINFDDAIVVNSDDESVDFDDEQPSLFLSIKVKAEPGTISHSSSVSVNMDEMDNKMQQDEVLNENVNSNNTEQQTVQPITITTMNNNNTTPSAAPPPSQQKSFESSDDLIIEDLDFSIGTTSEHSSSFQQPNIKLAGSNSMEQPSLVTQPTMESLQPSLTIDPSLVIPSPTHSPPSPTSPKLLTSEEEETRIEPPSTIPTKTSINTQPTSSFITQEMQHTDLSVPSQHKVKMEGKSNTLQDAISISSDDDSENEVMVDKVVTASMPQVIEESDHDGETSDEDDEEVQQSEKDEEEEEKESEYSSSEDEDKLDESDAVSTSSGHFKPSISVKRLATAFRMITKDICTGTFCCGGPLLTRVGLPGLQLIIPQDNIQQEPKLKYITFPLSNPEQAKEIIKLSKRVSKRSNEYYLNADQFVISNPGWNDMVAELINQCTRGNLGVSHEKSVSFQLYQLVLLREGENIRKKSKLPSNVFAQFLVQLPCSYKGGKTEVAFREEKLEYDFSTTSYYLPSYITYFTECENVEDSIEEGYKLYLVYNLIYDGKPSFKPSLETVYRVADNLKQIENLWTPQETPFAVYLLDSIKETECRVDLLKGQDLVLYNFISLFNDQFSLFDIYLGVFERTILRTNAPPTNSKKIVSDDEIYDSDDECSYLVKRLTNPKTGIVISQMFKVELSDTIPYDIAISSSNRNCLVIVPKKYHYISLKYMDAKTCYEGFISLFKESTTDPSKRDLCIDLAYSQTQSQFFKGKLLELIPIFLQLGDVELFKKFITPIPILDLTTWNTILKHFGITPLRVEFLTGLVVFVCCKTTDLEKRASQTFNYLIGLNDEQLSYDFIGKLLEKLDVITNNASTGILSIAFLVSLINICSRLRIEGETLGRIALKIIQTNPIETNTEPITQVLKTLFSQNQLTLCNQIFDVVLKRSQPQSFDKVMPLVVACISMLGVTNIKSRIVEFCNKMINTSTVVSALQIIETSVQKNDDKLLYLAKYFRKGVINCLQLSQITLNLCQKVLGVLYRTGFKDDISTITSIIIGKSGMIENSIHELLIPLIKWTDKELGKHAFLNPGFNSILQYCINMLRMSIGNTQIEEDWSINGNVACTCEYCVNLSTFLRDKSKKRFEFRRAEAQRNHVLLSAKAVAEKYLSFSVQKNGSPYCLVIEKKSTPNDAEKKKVQAVKETFDYLSRLSTTVMNLNNSTMAPSSSSSSINSTSSAKRSYPDSDSDSIRRINKRTK